MNVLTISSLVNKGGAAYIAKTLHEGFTNLDEIEAKYLVGYKKIKSNNAKNTENYIFSKYRIPYTPVLNLFTHNIIGKDLFSPKEKGLEDLISWADVIICHTLHSYFLNFETLFGLFIKLGDNKKIILVAHDSWHYTGRCAFIHNCDNWKNSCKKCPNPSYYPKSFFSISENQFNTKRELLNKIPDLTFVSPAKWICDDLKYIYKNKKVSLIRNSIDIDPFIKVNRDYTCNGQASILVSAVDLSQSGKVDLNLISTLLNLGVKVNFIGKNNPFRNHENAIDHGFISEREKYIEILNSVECYLFTSTIDIYPTVLVDALCSGSYVFYTESKGACEVMQGENNWLSTKITTAEEVYNQIGNSNFKEIIINKELRERKKIKALNFYTRNRMVEDYLKLF